MKVETDEAVELRLCGCRQSGSKPYCDCSHTTLQGADEDEPG